MSRIRARSIHTFGRSIQTRPLRWTGATDLEVNLRAKGLNIEHTLLIFNQQGILIKTCKIRDSRASDSEPYLLAVRNQQVVGSNPTGGSKNSSKYRVLRVHLRGHSVDLSAIVRDLSEFVKK